MSVKEFILNLFFQDDEKREVETETFYDAVDLIKHGKNNGFYTFKDSENESTVYPLHTLKKAKIIKKKKK